jgi:hypothetical protein
LTRVLAEQGLAGSKDFLKAGQILNADGVVLLNFARDGNNQVLTLRLLAVKPGVVLRQISAVWPPPDLSAWAGELGQRLESWWPKLTVLQKDAMPVSILNLRSAVRTAEAEGLERELTTLLYHRLSQQPEVFVLERRRLELLSEEQEWSGTTSNFWNGGYLLEGLINKERYDAITVSINGQVRAAGQATGITIELTGMRTNLPALIDELARRILAVTKAGGSLSEWHPAAEAQQYWEEAQWAAKWRMWREAQAASEASWALGRQTKEVADLRVRAWQETGRDHAGCTFELEQVLVSYSAPPDHDRFSDLRRAADLFEAGWKQFVAGQSPLDVKWFELGTVLVADLSTWLRHYYFMPEAREGQELFIQQAQQQADRICRLLMAHPDYSNLAQKALLARTRALWGSLWAQTPEAGLKLYRELYAAGEWPFVRLRFLNEFSLAMGPWSKGFYDPASPLLTGWKWSDRQRWTQTWDRFVGEWCSSTNPVVAIEGHYLRCCFAWFDEDFERELRGLLQLVWEHREALAQAGLLDGWQVDLRKLVGKSDPREPTPNRLVGLDSVRRQRIEKELWPEFDKKFTEFAKAEAAKKESLRVMIEAQKEQLRVMTEARNYFTTRNDFDFGSFARWERQGFSPGEARELLPVVQDYKRRLSELPPAGMRNPNWSNSVTRFEARLEATATGAPLVVARPATNWIVSRAPGTNRPPAYPGAFGGMGPQGVPPGMSPLGGPGNSPALIDLTTIGATNSFRGARFWRPDKSKFKAWQIQDLVVSDVVFREGRFWAEILFQEGEQYRGHDDNRAVICAIDPATFATEMFFVEQDQGLVPFRGFTLTGTRHFEIYQKALYFNVGEKLRRYSFTKNQWEAVPVPIDGWVQLDVVKNRFYLRTKDSLLVMNETGDGAEIVASNRRRPVQNGLDAVEQLGSALIFSGPTGNVCVAVADKLWAFYPSQNKVETVMEFPSRPLSDDGGNLFYGKWARDQDDQYYAWFSGQLAPELVLVQPPDPMFSPRIRFPSQMGRPQAAPKLPPARWELPARMRPFSGALAVASNQVWSFIGEIAVQSDQGTPQLKEINGRQGLLFNFDYHRKEPLVIPLKLEVPRDLVSGRELTSLVGNGSAGTTLFRATPAGLILTHHRLPGFWLLPQSELERQRREWQLAPPAIQYPQQTNLNATLSRP